MDVATKITLALRKVWQGAEDFSDSDIVDIALTLQKEVLEMLAADCPNYDSCMEV